MLSQGWPPKISSFFIFCGQGRNESPSFLSFPNLWSFLDTLEGEEVGGGTLWCSLVNRVLKGVGQASQQTSAVTCNLTQALLSPFRINVESAPGLTTLTIRQHLLSSAQTRAGI